MIDIKEHDQVVDLINTIENGDFNAAEELFNDVLAGKISDRLDVEKVAVADQVFNGVDAEDVEEDDFVEEDDVEEDDVEDDEE